MDVSVEVVGTRRSQAERRATMRQRLLDATLECLVEVGYAGTTTTLVSERAGVSRGAQLHHFPSRAALMAAAIEHLFDRMRSEYQETFVVGEEIEVEAAVDLLWAMFEKPLFAAVLDLYAAARTDVELRAYLVPVARQHQRHVFELARTYYPEAASVGSLDRTLQTVLDTMQGMAVWRFLIGELEDRDARLDELRKLARETLRAEEI